MKAEEPISFHSAVSELLFRAAESMSAEESMEFHVTWWCLLCWFEPVALFVSI